MSVPQQNLAQPIATAGSGVLVRESRELAQVIAQASGKFYEGTSRGIVFSATSVTGRAPGTTISTAPPILLYNPQGSGKRYEILKVSAANGLTGTLGSGALYHCGFSILGPLSTQAGTIPVVGSGAAITPICMDIGSSANTAAIAFSLGTLAAACTALYPAFQVGESVAGTTANPINTAVEDVDGAIVLEPGGGWALMGLTAAGATPLVLCGVIWREAPLS